MSKKKVIIIISFLSIIVLFILTQFKTLRLNNSEEIEIEIKNALIDYNKPYILNGEEKNKLIQILNGARLGPSNQINEIYEDNTIYIRLYGEGVESSNFPIYVYYFIQNPNTSKLSLNDKMYSIDKKHISQLTEFFKVSN